jgi:hypothetical protein
MSEPVLYAIQWDADDKPDERFVWADRKCVDNYLGRAVPRGRLVPLYANDNPQWISVAGRLPKNGTSVLASDGRTVVQMSYSHAYGFECVGGDEPVFTPTHWMPLPPPPVDAHTQPQPQPQQG